MTDLATRVFDELDDLLLPLRRIADAPDPLAEARRFLAACGWQVTVDVDLGPVLAAVGDLDEALWELRRAGTPADLAAMLSRLDDLAGLVDSIRSLGDTVGGLGTGVPPTTNAVAAFVEDLAHHLLLTWLERKGAPFDGLAIAGAIAPTPVEAAELGWLRRDAGEQLRLRLDSLGAALADPLPHLATTFAPDRWKTTRDAAATNNMLSRTLGPLLRRIGGSYRLSPDLLRAGNATMDVARVAVVDLPLPGLGPALSADVEFVSPVDRTSGGRAGPAVELRPLGSIGGVLTVGEATIDVGASVLIGGADPEFAPAVEITPAGVHVDGDVTLTLEADAVIPVNFVVGTARTGLVIGQITAGGFAAVNPGVDLGYSIGIGAGSFGVSSADLGAAIDSLVPFEVTVPLDAVLEWSLASGLRLSGDAALEIVLASRLGIGDGAEITDVRLSLQLGESVEVGVTAAASLQLGPVALALDRLGLTLVLERRAGGNLGGAHLSLALAPPTSAGIGLDLGVVSGGGYLGIDHELGRYEGIADLDVLGIGLAAVAIIDTQVPELDGWSMFFALFLDLPSLQLGFGFTLEGVGGIAGINRTIDQAALEQAVRSGSLDSVLFPADPIAEAPVIIETFSAMFPPAPGRYVFGPVVNIGWGTPALIEGRLGVVIELPDPIRIALLGSMSAVLPSPELELMAFRLDVAGFVDFGAATLALDASLHDSHVIGYAISGDMALRADLAGRPSFLLSLGGFHPGFTPPADFPALDRLSLGLAAGPLLEMSFECYFAITSNTVQFGAAYDFWAEVAGFGVEGGTEFDALIQFFPFLVRTHVGMHVAITAVGVDLAGVWLNADLDGPNPWHLVGTAEFKVLGLKEEIRVDVTVGGREREPAMPSPDVLGELVAALSHDDAWHVGEPAVRGVELVVAAGDAVPPDGTVSISQSLVPLDTRIERFGEATSLDHVELRVGAGEGFTATGELTDWFAPDQFFDLTPGEQLSAPSFELHKAGLLFGGGLLAGEPLMGTLTHEVSKLDPTLDAAGAPARAVQPYSGAADPRRAVIESGVTTRADAPVAVTAPAFGVSPCEYAVIDRLSGAAIVWPGSFMDAHATRHDPRHVVVRVRAGSATR